MALHVASLGGAGLALAELLRRAPWSRRRLGAVLGAVLAWRLAYFPIMVFSGHLASIVEWLLIGVGLPVLVYPAFLVAAGALHAAATGAAVLILAPSVGWLRFALLPVFLVAALVSFMKPADFHLLPDIYMIIEDPPPPPRAESTNPYLEALTAPDYFPTQRVILLAAGLTYATIPPSPWATTVKAVLVADFEANPRGATRDRVLEHYQAYRSAHPFLGCRSFSECPLP